MRQTILSATMRHVQDNQEISPSQHGSMKDRSCLTNWTSFCGKVTFQVDEEEAVNVVSLDFSKGFDTVELLSFPCAQFKQMLGRLNTIPVSA